MCRVRDAKPVPSDTTIKSCNTFVNKQHISSLSLKLMSRAVEAKLALPLLAYGRYLICNARETSNTPSDPAACPSGSLFPKAAIIASVIFRMAMINSQYQNVRLYFIYTQLKA